MTRFGLFACASMTTSCAKSLCIWASFSWNVSFRFAGLIVLIVFFGFSPACASGSAKLIDLLWLCTLLERWLERRELLRSPPSWEKTLLSEIIFWSFSFASSESTFYWDSLTRGTSCWAVLLRSCKWELRWDWGYILFHNSRLVINNYFNLWKN